MGGVTVSVVRVPWHTRLGGYDRLIDHLPGVRRLAPPAGRAGRRAAAAVHALAGRRCPLPFYPAEHCATDLAALVRPGALHVLYADEQFYFSRHRRGPTAVTYHRPPSDLAAALPRTRWRALLRRTDRIIVLDPHQRAFFADLVPEHRVHMVPHGVDTEAFAPATAPPSGRRPLVLTVGWWLRDWDVLHRTHELLRRAHGDDVEFAVVTRAGAGRSWHPDTRVLHGIPESALVSLYHRAAVVLLPLRDATANNALLEALACGVPAVATDIGGVRHYTGTGPGALPVPPGDPHAAAEAVSAVLSEAGTPADARRRAAARRRAEKFAWPLVADQVRTVHRMMGVSG